MSETQIHAVIVALIVSSIALLRKLAPDLWARLPDRAKALPAVVMGVALEALRSGMSGAEFYDAIASALDSGSALGLLAVGAAHTAKRWLPTKPPIPGTLGMLAALTLTSCGPAAIPTSGLLTPTATETTAIQAARDKWEDWGGMPDDLLDSVAGLMVTSEHPWIKRAAAPDPDSEFGLLTADLAAGRVIVGLYHQGVTLYVRDAIESLGRYPDALYLVAMHEFGHALGGPLGNSDGHQHSTNVRSVLFPVFHWESWILEVEFAYQCYRPECPDEPLD